eukprot:1350940-Rhodomonas_salina.1
MDKDCELAGCYGAEVRQSSPGCWVVRGLCALGRRGVLDTEPELGECRRDVGSVPELGVAGPSLTLALETGHGPAKFVIPGLWAFK